jgi:hypothetical protein
MVYSFWFMVATALFKLAVNSELISIPLYSGLNNCSDCSNGKNYKP